jgi:hypothetical protein
MPKKVAQEKIAQSTVVRISSMAELERYVHDDTLVLFDLDHTVFEGAYIYGHANWFYGRISEGRSQERTEEEVIKSILPMWLTSQERASVKAVESLTPALIKRLQARGIKVMALTAREASLIPATMRQLAEIDVNFSKSSLMPAVFGDKEFVVPVHFSNGIIFTSEFVKKSQVLKAYFDHIAYMPRHIVFVDDIKRHVEDLVNVFSTLNVSIVGLHYPLVQTRNTPWDQRLADDIFDQCNRGTTPQDQRCRQTIKKLSHKPEIDQP